jgi:radical SAM protein with 4Fe4S-binding SPASM domain
VGEIFWMKQGEGMSEFPKQIIIESTAYCNQRCIHCGHKTLKRKKGNMAMDLYKKIVDEVAAESPEAEVWMTYYGEALLLRYKLYYMIRYAKDRGLRNVVLNSNAMLLDRDMAEMLIDSHLDRFIVSMDGFSKETYEKIRVGGVYEKVLNNTLQFLALLKSQGVDRPKFEMQFSVMDENRDEQEAFNEFWRGKGAYVKNRPKGSWAGRIEACNLDPLKKRVPCKWALNHGAILWDGNLVACGCDAEGLMVAGNLNQSTLTEIWNTTHKKFRQVHLDERWSELPDVCKGCLDWQTTDRTYLKPEQ